MSAKPGTAIALPKGGGAIAGIGETFVPDLHTGAGNFAIPIALPPGRNGFQPSLELRYSTGAGNGPFGLGWSLSVPALTRKTSRGVPRYDDDDVFLLAGAEDLVRVAREGGVTRYRPRCDTTFDRIEHHRTATDDYWRVASRDGRVAIYGTEGRRGDDPAAVADPARPDRVFAWKLSRTRDPFGNVIAYEYTRDRANWDQLYLSRIRYADHEAAEDGFLIAVTLAYAERPDAFTDHRAAFELRTRLRCKRIDVTTHAGEARLSRSYNLAYVDEIPGRAAEVPPNAVSLLGSVEIVGHDSQATQTTQAMPPLALRYTPFDPASRTFGRLGGELPGGSLARSEVELVSLFANGLTDILEMDGAAVRYWKNLGEGRFAPPRPMPYAPAGVRLEDPSIQLFDANGDGRVDLVAVAAERVGYLPLGADGTWDARAFRRWSVAPSFDLEDPEVRIVDLDGDGVADVLRTGTRFECFFNDPARGWEETRFVPRREHGLFPDVSFSDPRVKLADMTGDGLTDIVLLHDGSVEYWPSLGHGDFGPCVRMKSAPRLPFGYDSKRVLLGDVDGDGVADLVHVEDGKVTVWINRAGEGFAPPFVVHGTPPVAENDAVRLVDLNGTGMTGLLFSADADGSARPRLFFLDLTGGKKPYLLAESSDGMGAATKIAYRTSTSFFLDDERAGTPWKTPLPFPVHVVASVETIDAISGGKLTSEFRYHHGCWDGAEREFRGFARVDRRDTQTHAAYRAAGLHGDTPFAAVAGTHFAAPLETRHFFDPGPLGDGIADLTIDLSAEHWPGDAPMLPPSAVDRALPKRARRDAARAMRGIEVRTELYALDGSSRTDRPYVVTERRFGVRAEAEEDGADEPRRVFFPHLVAERTTIWERGDDPLTTIACTIAYDAYGQPLTRVDLAAPRGRDPRIAGPASAPYLASMTQMTYASSAERYIVDRPASLTRYEIDSDGSAPALALVAGLGSATTRVIEQTLSYYDGAAFVGLPHGQVGAYGALVRVESLVLTPEVVAEAYPETPLILSADQTYDADAPAEFRALVPSRAGYTFREAAPHERGWFSTSTCVAFDFQTGAGARGLLAATRDAFGHETTMAYDPYAYAPIRVVNAAGLVTEVAHDPRTLLPASLVDPNGARTEIVYTPLGLVASAALLGREGRSEGDTREAPSLCYEYDLFAFISRRSPTSVRTTRRVQHANVPATSDETIQSVEYSDGYGRVVQTRMQAEDLAFGSSPQGDAGLAPGEDPPADAIVQAPCSSGERVVVSGWQTYDNKGRVVERYEPFFSCGWEFGTPSDAERGKKSTSYYDARGELVRSVEPNGAERRVVRGVPSDLTRPDDHAPTPWESYTYDANDSAGRTHPAESAAYASHWNTPLSVVVDALGRVVVSVERLASNEVRTTTIAHDLLGRVVRVTDALGRLAIATAYDLAGNALRVDSIDRGARSVIYDALGRAIVTRDGRGAVVFRTFDALERPTRIWARDDGASPITLRERFEYGSTDADRAAGRLGLLHRHYDEAGLVVYEAYDFRGRAIEARRTTVRDDVLLASPVEAGPFVIDWSVPEGQTIGDRAGALLEPTAFETSYAYDALDRPTRITHPRDVDGERKKSLLRYSRSGALRAVELGGAAFIEEMAYDAKGQRLLVAYGNGVMTRHAWDPETYRIARTRTERFTRSSPDAWRGVGAPLQDVGYEHDLVGNVVAIRDRTPGAGVMGAAALERSFLYDPLYQLRSATGREHAAPLDDAPWADIVRTQDPTATRAYVETYDYDATGNLVARGHAAGNGSFTRTHAVAASSNRLASIASAGESFSYEYDANGNVVAETTSRRFAWDYADRLRAFQVRAGVSEPSVYAQYLYDGRGRRVKKVVRKQGGAYEATTYVDERFEHRRSGGGAVTENDTIHVMDEHARVASRRVGPALSGDEAPAVTYHLPDHLGSSGVVVDESGAFVRREEFLPFGETSFGGYARKRYRFTGRERDEESGLSYLGARYYAPWLGRFTSADPAGAADGLNLYGYARNNPLSRVDPTGTTSVYIAQQRDPLKYPKLSEEKKKAMRDENRNFRNRAMLLNKKVGDVADRKEAFTGEEILNVLVAQSKKGPIKNVVLFGHSGPTALYPTTDRGLYRYKADMPSTAGTEARTLGNLKDMVASGDVKFTKDAVIILAGCKAAGSTSAESQSFARILANDSGATVIASVGGSDQFLASMPSSEKMVSHSGWIITRNVGGKLQSAWLDIKPSYVKDGQGKTWRVYELDPTAYLDTAPGVKKAAKPAEIPISFDAGQEKTTQPPGGAPSGGCTSGCPTRP